MKRTLQLIIFLLFCLSGWGQSDWVLKRDKDDIIIHTRESEDSPLKEYRAVATIESPIQDVYHFLIDLEKRPEWVINCLGLNIIDTTEDGKIEYQTSYDIPWPMVDREMVVRADFSFFPDSGKAHLLTLQSDIDFPLQNGLIRIPVYREEVFLERIYSPGSD